MLDVLRKYVDALAGFSELSRDRAEKIVRELSQRGEIRAQEVGKAASDLVSRSVKNRKELISLVRKEVDQQLKSMGISTSTKRSAPAKSSASTVKAKTKSTAKKAASKSKKTASKAKPTAAKAKSTAKAKTKSAAKSKPAAKAKSTAKKSAAKAKSTAKKSTGTKS